MTYQTKNRPTWRVSQETLATLVESLDYLDAPQDLERVAQALSAAAWPTSIMTNACDDDEPPWATTLIAQLAERGLDGDCGKDSEPDSALAVFRDAVTWECSSWDEYVPLVVEADRFVAWELRRRIEPLEEEELALFEAMCPDTRDELRALSARFFDLGQRSTDRITNGAILDPPSKRPPLHEALQIEWRYLVNTVRWASEGQRHDLCHKEEAKAPSSDGDDGDDF